MQIRILIILTFGLLALSCQRQQENSITAKLDDNSDTTEIIKKYSSVKVKEIVYYKNNKPFKNVGFFENGNTIKYPSVIFIEPEDKLFIFIPMHQKIAYEILIGMDSAKAEDTAYDKILADFKKSLGDLKTSRLVPVPNDLVLDSHLVGVFKCKVDTTGETFYYYVPFKAKISHF
jgi:hypothetical protein